MNYMIEMCVIITFIEERIKGRFEAQELEKSLHYSYRNLREILKKVTNMPLAHYIMSRKIANCVLEIVATKKKITEIAAEYGFESYDTFTRAFKREMGIRPSEFKASDYICVRKVICIGVYAPTILKHNNQKVPSSIISEVIVMKVLKTHDSCVLYGVPKVYYGRNLDGKWQGTPFPMCLQAVLDYMGQNIDYSYVMEASGAAFRLRWKENEWDFSAVDIRNIYEKPLMPFELAFKAGGRSYKILEK